MVDCAYQITLAGISGKCNDVIFIILYVNGVYIKYTEDSVRNIYDDESQYGFHVSKIYFFIESQTI